MGGQARIAWWKDRGNFRETNLAKWLTGEGWVEAWRRGINVWNRDEKRENEKKSEKKRKIGEKERKRKKERQRVRIENTAKARGYSCTEGWLQVLAGDSLERECLGWWSYWKAATLGASQRSANVGNIHLHGRKLWLWVDQVDLIMFEVCVCYTYTHTHHNQPLTFECANSFATIVD